MLFPSFFTPIPPFFLPPFYHFPPERFLTFSLFCKTLCHPYSMLLMCCMPSAWDSQFRGFMKLVPIRVGRHTINCRRQVLSESKCEIGTLVLKCQVVCLCVCVCVGGGRSMWVGVNEWGWDGDLRQKMDGYSWPCPTISGSVSCLVSMVESDFLCLWSWKAWSRASQVCVCVCVCMCVCVCWLLICEIQCSHLVKLTLILIVFF